MDLVERTSITGTRTRLADATERGTLRPSHGLLGHLASAVRILVIKSGFFPKLLGYLLIVGCFAYLAVSVSSIAVPAYGGVVSLVALPFFMIGELSMIVWLLVKGARET